MAQNSTEWIVTAELARLKLGDTEAKHLAQEAEKMRELFLTMSEADVNELAPTTHATSIGNRIRKDVYVAFSDIEVLIAAAPESEDNFFLIPNVL